MAQTGSGTVQDWIDSIGTNHYLTTSYGPATPDGDTDDDYAVWFDGPAGQEEYGVIAQVTGGDLYFGAGTDADYSSDFLSFNGEQYWQNRVDGTFPGSLSASFQWWYEVGSDWFWTVAYWDAQDRTYYLAWQTVNDFWPYYELRDTARVAMLHQGPGLHDGPTWCAVDSARGWVKNHDFGNNAGTKTATLTEDDSWRVAGPSTVAKTDGNRTLIGTVDAWGYDPADSRPQHLDTISCSNKNYQYISPGAGDDQLFFRTA